MTANDIFTLASALIFETTGEDPDTSAFTPSLINISLQELLLAENTIRAANGNEELSEAPTISSLTDTVSYSAGLIRTAIPYNLVSHYFRDNNDNYHEQWFYQKYVEAVQMATPFVIGTISGVYDL